MICAIYKQIINDLCCFQVIYAQDVVEIIDDVASLAPWVGAYGLSKKNDNEIIPMKSLTFLTLPNTPDLFFLDSPDLELYFVEGIGSIRFFVLAVEFFEVRDLPLKMGS